MGKEDLPTENNDDLDTDDLEIFLTELAEYYSGYELKPGEFTVNMVMEKASGDPDRGRVTNGLKRRVKAGELGMKKRNVDGKNRLVFWRESKD
jgi:hypothetical protein